MVNHIFSIVMLCYVHLSYINHIQTIYQPYINIYKAYTNHITTYINIYSPYIPRGLRPFFTTIFQAETSPSIIQLLACLIGMTLGPQQCLAIQSVKFCVVSVGIGINHQWLIYGWSTVIWSIYG